MGLKVIIGSTSTPQIHSMCIPHRRNTTPTNILCLVMGDLCLSITITHTTADQGQEGQEIDRPGKTCITGNLGRAKTNSSFPTKLLYYKISIGGLVTRQTQLTIKATIVFHLYI